MKKISQEFIHRQRYIDDWEYLNSTVFVASAPTIAGLKPATLIQLGDSGRSLLRIWRKYEKIFTADILRKADLNCCPLAASAHCMSLLIYKERFLQQWLGLDDVRYFLLKQAGKDLLSPDESIEWIQHRMKNQFPHEIGVILGYPTDDILAFIENKGRNYLINGYWKVYHHPRSATHIFASYDHVKVRVMEYFITKWDKLNQEVK